MILESKYNSDWQLFDLAAMKGVQMDECMNGDVDEMYQSQRSV